MLLLCSRTVIQHMLKGLYHERPVLLWVTEIRTLPEVLYNVIGSLIRRDKYSGGVENYYWSVRLSTDWSISVTGVVQLKKKLTTEWMEIDFRYLITQFRCCVRIGGCVGLSSPEFVSMWWAIVRRIEPCLIAQGGSPSLHDRILPLQNQVRRIFFSISISQNWMVFGGMVEGKNFLSALWSPFGSVPRKRTWSMQNAKCSLRHAAIIRIVIIYTIIIWCRQCSVPVRSW